MPAVSFVKPDGLLDGHPASSKVDLFEGMVKKIMDHLTANPELFADTVLFITMDEGGGYYDSGYIQPLDFFGDGPRIPMIAVSPFSRGGHISHTYTDHVSILKFIERNWDLKPLTDRSRDNFPNPRSDERQPLRTEKQPRHWRSVRPVRFRERPRWRVIESAATKRAAGTAALFCAEAACGMPDSYTAIYDPHN